MTIELGPFKLLRPIGKGGMGVVWQGLHVDTAIPVAVKVITQRVSRDERTLKAFKNEVRAVAGLDHPGVVWVADYGEVDEAASVESKRQLTHGSPYLVMEMASGGTLASFKDGLPWPQLKGMLLSLLDALAHAHARGVIHRDLKPGNVLVCTESDLRPGLKLTDFGIAHAREETVSDSMSNHVIGTLHYMAPEQIRADWRDYGPWTDLYALGTIAYKLATGSLPYKGKRGASLMVAQMNHRPPPLQPVYAVAEGFEDWLLTMMRKEHWRRFQCAADAALALAALPDPPSVEDLPIGLPITTGPGSHLVLEDHPTTLVLEDPFTKELTEVGSAEETATLPTPMMVDSTSPEQARRRGELDRLRPLIPADWRRPEAGGERERKLKGAGLGLWGLRTLPLVGRQDERDAIWQSLLDVHRTRQTRVVLCTGSAGVGKTSLVEWISQRAVEIGCAHLLKCRYHPDDEPAEGLRRMLRRYFRVARLDEEQRQQRVLEVCDTFGETDVAQAARVVALLDPVDSKTADGGARHNAARWLFTRMGADRPLVLWLDDAHYGVDGLKLVTSILKAQPARILVVLNVTEEALANREVETQYIEALREHEAVSTLNVGPLSEPHMRVLVREMLGLEENLAEQVVKRAAGSPQFAIQLVGDWIQKGILERSGEGFQLPEGRTVPASMGQVWVDRIEQLVEGLPPLARQMLERAAVLGVEVEEEEWREACDDPDGRLRRQGSAPIRRDHAIWRATLVDRLLTNRLAEEREHGFAFAQEELRATLLKQAKRKNRLGTHHRAVATMLARRTDPAPERLGMHLLAAGELDAAIEALMRGVRNRSASVGPRAALSLLDFTEQALTDAGLPPDDDRWGRLWMMRADIAVQRGRMEDALQWARKVSNAADEHAWVGIKALAVFVHATVALFRKDAETAEMLFSKFERVAIPDAHALHRAAARHALSLLAEGDGRASRARTQAEVCTEWLARAQASLADVWKVLGTRALLATYAGAAMLNLERRKAAYEVEGQLEGLAECWMMLARGTRKAGSLDRAERCLQHAVRLYVAAESPFAEKARVQMALLRLTRGDFAGAEQLALEVARTVRDGHRKPVLLRANALLAACAAGSASWRKYAEYLGEVQRLQSETGNAEREVAWALARAGDLAMKARQNDHATEGWRLALEQYKRLGDEGQSRRLTTLLQRS
ncbi:MAG: protein kinase [Alphaproteobacteria bacterium]|nr:protein kinase [Alphaproteobacteria bacterium]